MLLRANQDEPDSDEAAEGAGERQRDDPPALAVQAPAITHRASDVAGATLIVTLAINGGHPTAISAGKEPNEPPQAAALIAAATKPAPASRTMAPGAQVHLGQMAFKKSVWLWESGSRRFLRP